MSSAVGDAVAFLTCWFADDRDLARRIGSQAVTTHPGEFLESLGGIAQVLHDVAEEERVDLAMILRNIALGAAIVD